MTAGDDLLRWASEVGSGSWDRLRDASAYVCQRHSIDRRPWVLASQLSALGHLDIDWETRGWSIAPLSMNLVPGLGICVVLTGSRPHYVDLRFETATDDLDIYPFEIPQPPSSAAKFAKCASVEVAEQVAQRMKTSLILDPGGSLAAALRAVDEVPQVRSPEPALEEATKFNVESLRWDQDHNRGPGLYRIDLHGRPVHRRLDSYDLWWAVDLAAGQFLELRGASRPVMQWLPGERDGGAVGALEVRSEIALPVLAERAVCVSSGLLPQYHNGWRRYLNVPKELARTIASKLHQKAATQRDQIEILGGSS